MPACLVELQQTGLPAKSLALLDALECVIFRQLYRNEALDPNQDDRLDVWLETDAAMRHLKTSHSEVEDRQLALLAYNIGDRRLTHAISETGSRYAWTLIHRGYEGDKNYLARVMAVVLILKTPQVLR